MSGQGLAFRMRLELSQLARRHRVEPKLSCALPLADPHPRPVIISGMAMSCSVDQERMRFRPWSLSYLPWRPPQLLFRHKEPAGEILKLRDDAKGRLVIEARVDHPEARRCAGLSVAATIEAYELREIDDPDSYHALITRARLDEISLTPTPADPKCTVTSRLPVSPLPEYFDLARKGVDNLIRQVELLQQLNREPPPPQPVPRHPHAQCPPRGMVRTMMPSPSRRVTDFSRLGRRDGAHEPVMNPFRKSEEPAMFEPVVTGTDILRQTVAHRSKSPHALTAIAREIDGLGTAALEAFAHGKANLAADKLQALTKVLYGGHAELCPDTNMLRSANKTPARSMRGAYSEPYAPPPNHVVPSNVAGSHSITLPQQPELKKTRPGWLGSFW
jgi:hypothetical protein